MADGYHTHADEEALKSVLVLSKKRKIGEFDDDGALTPAFSHFLEQLVRFATGEDRLWSEPAALLDRAASAWDAGAMRKPDQKIIQFRLLEAKDWRETRLVLDITTNDRPFLVDSISGALADAGKPLSFFSNAVVDARRDSKGARSQSGKPVRESIIHAEMDPPVDQQEIEDLEAELIRVLDDVSLAVNDWEAMRGRLASCIAQLESSRPAGIDREAQREAIEFLKWLWDNRFAFLGIRRYVYEKDSNGDRFEHDPDGDLGILRDANRRVLKSTHTASGDLSPAVEAFLNSGEPLIVAKANAKSLVHRRVFMDYIGVKNYAIDGTVLGEDRFVGLFTTEAYTRRASDIPLLRAKIQKVLEASPFMPGGHNEKALVNILETFPRDELFQIDGDDLREIALGMLRLFKRPRVKLFLRRDRFNRFISAFVFVPRERYFSSTREAIGDLLSDTFDGRVTTFSPSFGDASLVRVHFIIGINQNAPDGPGIATLTRKIRTICRDWRDDLLEEMRAANNGAIPSGIFAKYENAFDAGYREQVSAAEAMADIAMLEMLPKDGIRLRAYRKTKDSDDKIRIKIYREGSPLSLSKVIPTIENLGLDVLREQSYVIRAKDDDASRTLWLHDFLAEQKQRQPIDLDAIKTQFEEAFHAILSGRCEDDRFNALVVAAGINWREAWLIRAAAKHHMQAGFAFSQSYIEEALVSHPQIAGDLIAAFHARFNPDGAKNPESRKKEVAAADERIMAGLENVASLDEDRIIRRFMNLFAAITRTNYYQTEQSGDRKSYISFKVDSHKLDELPEPKPYREIFVSGPRVDGVHLRFGPIARGGLRWSDRREDFRTEVLGLVKAQRVKNAVIIPNGSKGGFHPKQLPVDGDRSAIYEEGREAYKVFIRGLLDLTDNIVGGKVVAPRQSVIWDEADPYLVVAADKGTAQFSDTANAIADDYGFWLGDAFASGGSVGYDHKVMGITARGAWEAVKRHFREMGKDIQAEPFTAAGVGDMSGDVFGNGMLLSEKTKVIAAFDHRDIFIDPDPDPSISYAERKRLFNLPRSSWQEYDPKLISKGGGVFSRSKKSVKLTPEIQKTLGLKQDSATPAQIVNAILKMEVELFWLGGIGTYFKASEEENWRVGDRANDAVRINANEMGAKVIGEGANLGLTQKARIEFARAGGRINTDAIDNSAGVDSSDHEVNIKILLASAIELGDLEREDRNDLLSSMTEDVAEHVLRHNYEQTRALTQMESTASEDIDLHARFMIALEREGRLNRSVEDLPDIDAIAALKNQNEGLSRPELSVLLAYSKLWLFDEIVASEAPDDPSLEQELFAYFPDPLHEYPRPLLKHRLRREIIATRLANEIADTCGLGFVYRAVEATGASFADVTLAYEAARRIYELGDFSDQIDALDNKVGFELQTALYLSASTLLREQMYRIVSDRKITALLDKQGLKGVIAHYKKPIADFKTHYVEMSSSGENDIYEARVKEWVGQGAPKPLARRAAMLPALERAIDIVDLSRDTKWSMPATNALFFAIGRKFNIDALKDASRANRAADHFDQMATRRILEALTEGQRKLCNIIADFAGAEPEGPPEEWIDGLLEEWSEAGGEAMERFDRFVAELDLTGALSVGKLSLLGRKLQELSEWMADAKR